MNYYKRNIASYTQIDKNAYSKYSKIKKISRVLLITSSNKTLGNTIRKLIYVITIIFLTIIVKDVYKRTNDKTYYINRISIPKEFEEQGINSDMVQQLLLENISTIQSKSDYAQPSGTVQRIDAVVDIEISKQPDLEYDGASYNKGVEFISNLFNKRKYIECGIISNNAELIFHYSFSDRSQDGFFRSTDSIKPIKKIYSLAFRAAEEIINKLNPLKLILFQYSNSNFNKCSNNVLEQINKTKDKKELSTLYNILGDCYNWSDRDSLAIICYKQSIFFNPKSYGAYDQLAAKYMDKKIWDSVKLLIQRASIEIEDVYKIGNYANLKGNYYLYLKQYDSAVSYYKLAINNYKYEPAYFVNLGSLYATIGNYDSAAVYLDHYTHNFPSRKFKNNLLFTSMGFNQTPNEFSSKKDIILSNGAKFKYLPYSAGLFFFQKEDFAKAEEYLNKALLIDPNFADALYYLSRTYSSQRKFIQANEILIRLNEINGYNPDATEQMGYNLLNQGDYTSALLQIIEDKSADYCFLGQVYEMKGDLYEATFCYTMADLINPINTYNLSCFANFKKKYGDVQSSINLSNRSLQLDSLNSEALENIAECYIEQNRLIDARNICEILSNHYPSKAFSILGKIEVIEGNEEIALQHFRKSYETNRNDPGVLRILAHAYTTNNDFQKASHCWEQLEKISSLGNMDLVNFGVCLLKNGQVKKSVTYFRKAFLQNPDNCTALKDWCSALIASRKNPFSDFNFNSALNVSNCDLSQWIKQYHINETIANM